VKFPYKRITSKADPFFNFLQHAAFMAEELGFGVVDAVIKALDDSGYSKQTAQNVMIQSTNSSVLVKFKQETKYNLVYMIEESVRDAAPSSLADIKKFADAVSVGTTSVFPETHYYLTNQTNKLVPNLKSAGLQVYVYVLMNEFASQPNDFFADATSQINAYVQSAKVDGVITDFPGTAHRYKRKFLVTISQGTVSFVRSFKYMMNLLVALCSELLHEHGKEHATIHAASATRWPPFNHSPRCTATSSSANAALDGR
jgi:hypothetical protein